MKIKLLLLILQIFLLSGCGLAQAEIGPKKEVSSYSEHTVELMDSRTLDLSCDSSDIEVYTWEKDTVKFEVTKRVKGALKSEVLEEKLKDFKIDIRNTGKTVYFSSKYNGSIKNPLDRSIDLKIYLPKSIDLMNYKMDIGNIKFFDDIKGILNAELNMAHMEVNRFDGILNVSGDIGNVKIGSGKLKGESRVERNIGNISIKSEFDVNGNYSFKTNMGYIDLLAPSDSELSFETLGELEINEFGHLNNAPKVRIESGMGKITVKKY